MRRWPNIEPTLNKCTMFERKSSCSSQQTQDICITFIQRRPNVFDVGASEKSFELLTHRCIYELAVILALALNEALGMKRIFCIIME